MADAPSSGGGISGGEIALLLVLGIGALAILSGHPILGVQNNNTSSNSTTASTTQQCGITLSRPTSKESIGAFLTVVGAITPCTTDAPISATVNVQVVDSTGAPMSAYTLVDVAAATNIRGTFSANIPITGQPAAGTGYVIVTGPTSIESGSPMTARAPVHFVGTRTPIIYSNTSTGINNNGTPTQSVPTGSSNTF